MCLQSNWQKHLSQAICVSASYRIFLHKTSKSSDSHLFSVRQYTTLFMPATRILIVPSTLHLTEHEIHATNRARFPIDQPKAFMHNKNLKKAIRNFNINVLTFDSCKQFVYMLHSGILMPHLFLTVRDIVYDCF